MFDFEAVATAIAALNVTGLTIKDFSGIPDGVTDRMCPILFPDPGIMMSNFLFERESFGTATAAAKDMTYDMTWVLLYAPVSSVVSRAELKVKTVRMIAAILTAFRNADTLNGCDDINPSAVSDLGFLSDGAGNDFIGCHLTLRVLEYL